MYWCDSCDKKFIYGLLECVFHMEGENQMSVSDILGENELYVWMK